jgi:hypothetical protein
MPRETSCPGAALNVQGCTSGSETLAGISDSRASNCDPRHQDKAEAEPSIRIGQVRVQAHQPDRFATAMAETLLPELAIDSPRAYRKSSAAFSKSNTQQLPVRKLKGDVA